MEIFKKLKKYGWVLGVLKNADKELRSNVIDGYKNRKSYYTSPIEGFEADLKKAAKCANCPNMCRFDCPALNRTKIESYAPANKARISLLMGMNHIPLDESSAIDALYACMNCDSCYEWCPMSISTGDILVQMRSELEKKNLIPERMHPLKKTIEENGSIFEKSIFKEFADSQDFNQNDPKPEILYYIGCMDLKYRKESVKATFALLKHLKIPFCTKLETRECCGGPVYKAGFKETVKKISQNNIDLIDKCGAKTILTTCPGCLETLKMTYPEVYEHKMKKIDVVHATDFFKQKIDQGKLKLTKSLGKSMTYHDPCILARNSSELQNREEVRELFSLIPGLTVKEAYLAKHETQCCGMGGAYHVSNPEYSDAQALLRFNQLSKHDTDYIVSGCPSCEYGICNGKEQFEANNKSECKSEVVDIVELIAQSAGIDY